MNRKGKRGSVTYSSDREKEVSNIFIISLMCVSRVLEQFLYIQEEQLHISDSPGKQNESI